MGAVTRPPTSIRFSTARLPHRNTLINYCPAPRCKRHDPYRVFNVINQSNYYFIFVLFKTGDNQTDHLTDPGTWHVPVQSVSS